MAYKHVDESRKGDDYVIGHKRLRIDHTKAVFTGLIGLLTAAMIGGEFIKPSYGTYISYAGVIFAVLWGAFAFIETSTIYYSETPCFSTKSIKLIYIVFFITIALGVLKGFRAFKLLPIIELSIIGLIIYLFYKMIKKAAKRRRASRREIKMGQ